MRFGNFSFGAIEIDGKTFESDVVLDRGEIRKRKKGPSKVHRDEYGHTPLSAAEDIPWDCRRLIVGTGAFGSLPVMEEVAREAKRHGVRLVAVPTTEAISKLKKAGKDTNAILHITC